MCIDIADLYCQRINAHIIEQLLTRRIDSIHLIKLSFFIRKVEFNKPNLKK